MNSAELPTEPNLRDQTWYLDVAGGAYFYEAEGHILSNGNITVQPSSSTWFRLAPVAMVNPPPPLPNEPTQPAAAVLDGVGQLWVRTPDKDTQPWRGPVWGRWQEIPHPITVLSEGVTLP